MTVLGIDFGGTTVKMAVVRGSEITSETFLIDTQDYSGPDALIDVIVSRITEVRKEFPEIAAIGVGVPGAIDFEEGVTYNLTNVKGWSNVPLRSILSEKTGLPCVVENDANCMTYAEWKHGAGNGFKNVICVTLGTGVGGGLILDGRMYRGSQFAAGEIGQMSIDLNGVPGPYGNDGALERYIGNRQIEDYAQALYQEKGSPVPEDCSPAGLAALAEAGDQIALEAWDWVASCLANCLSSCIYLLNPDAIVIGGGVAHAGDLLFAPLRQKLEASLTEECSGQLQICSARFGNSAGIRGSAALASELV